MKHLQARQNRRVRGSRISIAFLLAVTAAIIFNVAGAIRPETFWVVPLREVPEDIFSSEYWAEPNYVAQKAYLSHLFDEVVIITTQIEPQVRSDLQSQLGLTATGYSADDMSPLDASSLDSSLSQGTNLFPNGSETGCSFFSSESASWVRKKSRCAVEVWAHPDSLRGRVVQFIQVSDGSVVWFIDRELLEAERP